MADLHSTAALQLQAEFWAYYTKSLMLIKFTNISMFQNSKIVTTSKAQTEFVQHTILEVQFCIKTSWWGTSFLSWPPREVPTNSTCISGRSQCFPHEWRARVPLVVVGFKTDSFKDKVRSEWTQNIEVGIFYFLLDIFPFVPLSLYLRKNNFCIC